MWRTSGSFCGRRVKSELKEHYSAWLMPGLLCTARDAYTEDSEPSKKSVPQQQRAWVASRSLCVADTPPTASQKPLEATHTPSEWI